MPVKIKLFTVLIGFLKIRRVIALVKPNVHVEIARGMAFCLRLLSICAKAISGFSSMSAKLIEPVP